VPDENPIVQFSCTFEIIAHNERGYNFHSLTWFLHQSKLQDKSENYLKTLQQMSNCLLLSFKTHSTIILTSAQVSRYWPPFACKNQTHCERYLPKDKWQNLYVEFLYKIYFWTRFLTTENKLFYFIHSFFHLFSMKYIQLLKTALTMNYNINLNVMYVSRDLLLVT
jgi:hypothetical protein